MAKINKKKSKIQLKTKQIKRNKKSHNELKECFVNLSKISDYEYEIYSKSDIIKTASFHLRINGNELEIGDHGNGLQTQHSEARIFNITLKKRSNLYVLENSLEIAAPGKYTSDLWSFEYSFIRIHPIK